MRSFRRLLTHIMPDRLVGFLHALSNGLADPNAQLSFSQEGEDLIILRIFDGQGRGFYVDVGAHHPTRFSNPYLLYR